MESRPDLEKQQKILERKLIYFELLFRTLKDLLDEKEYSKMLAYYLSRCEEYDKKFPLN